MKESIRLTSFVTSRPVAVLMVFLAAVVFGYLSYGRLPVTLMPELTYPTLTVRTDYPGAAPEEVENDISRPIEEQLGVIGGLSKISSVSRAGGSDVVLEFAWDTEMSDATQAVLEKLDTVFLPTEAGRPLILHYDPSLDPVMELSLSGQGERFEGEPGMRRLRRLAELQLKRELEPIKGVAAVRVRGGLEEEIHIALEEEALRSTGISIDSVMSRLAQENINVAGGTLTEGRTEYLVRTLNEFQGLDQIRDTVVDSFDGREVRIRDLGQVSMRHREREILTRTDGGESVQIEIYKEGDANIVDLAGRVKATLGELDVEALRQAASPSGAAIGQRGPLGIAQRIYEEEGAQLEIVADRSLFIESSIDEVRNTALIGGLLAILILYVFLRSAKSTAIVAVSIPISLLITFAPLNSLGVSLNIMSLGGLALGIGMLVDSSIVVLESIYRCREEGDDEVSAANRGTTEVRGAVVASTLTSIAVFFPMVFVEGIAGQAFGDLGAAVVVSLLASAAVALFFIPMLAIHTRLGLGVVATLCVALAGMAAAGLLKPMLAIVGGLLLLGLLFTITMLLRGRLNIDESMRRTTGLWQWSMFRSLKAGFPAPAAYVAGIASRFKTSGRPTRTLGYLAVPIWLPIALAAFLLAYLYILVRFTLGSVFEWLVGKPLLLSILGATSLVRLGAPLFGKLFSAIVWLPLKLTGAVLESARTTYPSLLRAALARPFAMLSLVVVCFWASWQIAGGLGSELLPEVHQGEFTVEVALPVGTPLQETARVLAPIEQAILEDREMIRSLALTLGFDSTDTRRSDEGEHTARFKVLIEPGDNLIRDEALLTERLRKKFADIPDIETRIVRPVLFSSQTPIEVEIHGDDLIELRRKADEVATTMAALPVLTDVESSLRRGAPEVQIVYDRDRLSRYGLNIQDVAQLVRSKVQGSEATRFNMKDRRIPIIVRLAIDDRETVDDVRSMIVNPGGERPISLASVAQVTLGEGPSEVRRIDSQRVSLIRANIADGSLSNASIAVENALNRGIEWPADMSFYISGQQEEWDRSQRSLLVALALSIFLVYVIMASQFESLIQPLVIMLTIPLAFFGTVLSLKLLGISLSVVVFLGMIMLAGIVVNNAIVLVDYVNTLRARGTPLDEAVIQAGSVRLRPILMTTATTVLGLMPMALGLGDGAEIRTPMAIAVISGLITSTALTLVVIPSMYVLADRTQQYLSGRRQSPAAADVPLPEAGAEALPS